MKIAVTYENGQIFQHFGHTEMFKVYEVEDNSIKNESIIPTLGSGHGALAGFLKLNNVDTLICGGIGEGAKNALADAGIKLYGGVTGDADSAVKALLEGEIKLAAAAIRIDQEIDRKEREIESMCLKLLLQQQPVARDLRVISAALKMITDMERIGDQAEDIAEIVQFLAGRSAENDDLLREMARLTIHMVTESVDAYVQRDTMLAETVIAEDDVVDNAFDEVKRRLIDKIAAHPDDGEYALDLLMIAKYFERIGDHATNIAEWVIFSVTGVHKEG